MLARCRRDSILMQFHRTYATPRSGITAEGTRLYRASKRDCDRCELRPRCCPHMPTRKVPRDLNEEAHDVARAIATTPEYVQSRHRRKGSRCSLHTSSASCAWRGCGFEDHVARRRIPACRNGTELEEAGQTQASDAAMRFHCRLRTASIYTLRQGAEQTMA